MINPIKQQWHSFKKRPDIWFFYIFLATFTLSIRKVLYFYPINNSFNEYSGVYIYLSDLFLISTLLLYILYNNKLIMSNIISFFKNQSAKIKMFHACPVGCSTHKKYEHISTIKQNVPRGTFPQEMEHSYWGGTSLLLKKTYALFINNYLIIFPLFIAFFSFISILWTTNRPIAIFRSIKLIEFIFLYFYIISIVPRGTILQKTNTAIKKLKQMFHVEHSKGISKNENLNCSTWNNFTKSREVNVPRLPRRMFQTLKNILFKPYLNKKICKEKMFHVEHSYWGGTFIRNVFLIIIVTGVIQATIGIVQFLIQKSIGLFWLKESIISSLITGVAKIILNGDAYIRAYGLFPHPNILGGFLIFSILISFLYLKLFHVEHFEGRECMPQLKKIKCSTWNILKEKVTSIVPRLPRRMFQALKNIFFNPYLNKKICNEKMFHVEHFYWGGTIWKIFISIQLIALSLTFSKSAIIGLLVGLFYLYTILKIQNVPRGTLFEKYKNIKCSTWNISTRVENFRINILITFIVIVLFTIIAKPDLNSLIIKSLEERMFYLSASYEMFLSHPFIGVGAGQFIFNLMEIPSIQAWQFQPVHNVFLLILNEFGIFIMLGFLYFIFKLFHACPVGCSNNSKSSSLNFTSIKKSATNKCSTWNIPTGVEQFEKDNILIVPRGTITILSIFANAILLAFIFIMLFDHYFWDIQQGQILLWMIFGFIASQNKQVDPDQRIA